MNETRHHFHQKHGIGCRCVVWVCRPEVPDGRLSGHTPRTTALTTATSLEMASIDALKPLGSVVFPPLIDLLTTICRCLSTTRPRLHHHTARPANPRISDRCRMSTHGASLRPGGGVWPSCFPGLRYSASGAQHPPLTLVPRGGRAGLLQIPGRSVLLSGAHTATLVV